jgi:hypothetical protein
VNFGFPTAALELALTGFRNRTTVPPRNAMTFGSHGSRRRTSAKSNAGEGTIPFISSKTPVPFTVRSGVQLDLAIQRSLDPEVRSLRHVATLPLRGDDVVIDMMVADCEDGSFALDVVDGRPVRDLDAEGLLLLALEENGIELFELSTDDVLAEPFASNCRLVWRHRYMKPSTAMLSSIGKVLTQAGRISIGELSTTIGFVGDLSPFIYSMVCADELEIDLLSPLDRRTSVALRQPRQRPIDGERGR